MPLKTPFPPTPTCDGPEPRSGAGLFGDYLVLPKNHHQPPSVLGFMASSLIARCRFIRLHVCVSKPLPRTDVGGFALTCSQHATVSGSQLARVNVNWGDNPGSFNPANKEEKGKYELDLLIAQWLISTYSVPSINCYPSLSTVVRPLIIPRGKSWCAPWKSPYYPCKQHAFQLHQPSQDADHELI